MGNAKITARTCIGCRNIKDKKDLIRIVKNKDNEIFLDRSLRANGRGAYICNNVECFEKVKKSKALERTFKMKVEDKVYKALEEELNE